MSHTDCSLTAEEMGRFFVERSIQWACPVCGAEKWHAVGPRGASDVATMMMDMPRARQEQDQQSRVRLPVVMLVCAHCGFVRTHAVQPIKNGLTQENKTNEGETNDNPRRFH